MDHVLNDAQGLGDAIRSARSRLALSQEALASRIGVGRMTVSRLERGEEVSMATALDAFRVCGLAVTSAPARGWMTAAEHAGAIAEELARADHDFALRLLRQALEDLDHLATHKNHGAIEEFLAQPPSIHDERWERLLVLAIAVACDRHGVQRPAWAYVTPLDEPFFPARPSRRFIARTVERTPPDFAQANIWIDTRDLSYA